MAQVSFSDQNLSVIVFAVVVVIVVNFSHVYLLLQNHWANFNHIWHKAFLEEPYPFPRGDNYQIAKIH